MQRSWSVFIWFAREFVRVAAVIALVAALPLWASAATQEPPAVMSTVSGARVTFSGEIGQPGPKADIAARAGTRMGVELVPEGSVAGAPVTLDVRIARPGGLAPLAFQVAATLGAPALCAYEFAYDWEAVPGVWTFKISHDGKELASEDLSVVRTPADVKPVEAAPTADNPSPGAVQNPGPNAALRPEAAAAQQAETSDKLKSPPQAAPSTASSAKAAWTAAPQAVPQSAPQTSSPVAPKKELSPEKSPGQKMPANKSSGQQAPVRKATGQKPTTGKAAGEQPLAKDSSTQKPPVKGDVPQEASKGVPPQKTPVGANPGQQKFVLINGVYSQENRAMWVAALLKSRSVKACVRKSVNAGKPEWSVVAGWKDTHEQALNAKRKLPPAAGESRIVPMATGELETGLVCT